MDASEEFTGEETKLVIDMDFGDKSLEQCVAEALGAASACWSKPETAGVFLSDQCYEIHQQLMNRIEVELIKKGAIY